MVKLGKKEKEVFNKSAKELLENSYKNIYARDEKGRTVLHYAVDAKTVRLLVEKGVDVNAADVGGYSVPWRHKVSSENNKLSAKAAQQMRVGPSEPVYKNRFQTTISCFGKEPR